MKFCSFMTLLFVPLIVMLFLLIPKFCSIMLLSFIPLSHVVCSFLEH
jgi:hypothetical protein